MLGAEEGAINIIRKTVTRLLDLDVEMAYRLASHGHNATIGPSVFFHFNGLEAVQLPLTTFQLE